MTEYAFKIPSLDLETVKHCARLAKEMFSYLSDTYIQSMTQDDFENDIPDEKNRGLYIVTGETSNELCWGWNPKKWFCFKHFEVIDMTNEDGFVGAIE